MYPIYNSWDYVANILPLNENEMLISTQKGILYTSDKGLTWSGDSLNIGLDFLVKDNRGNIYAGFEPIYKSTDKGKTWTIFQDSLYTLSFYITSSGNLLAGTICGIYLSDDDGKNWIRTGYFNCGDVTVIKGIDDDGLIFIGGADRFHGIYYSKNGGRDWDYVNNSDTVKQATSIIPINNNEIYFGSYFYGVFRYNIQDSVLTSINDGLPYGVSSVALDSLGFLYAASDGIYKTTSTLDSSKYIRNKLYNYSLEQNYPNPFNSSTTIEYSLETSGRVKINIFNTLGQKVSEIANKFQPKGKYRVIFKAASLSSGVYFYSISIPGFTQTKKMILLH